MGRLKMNGSVMLCEDYIMSILVNLCAGCCTQLVYLPILSNILWNSDRIFPRTFVIPNPLQKSYYTSPLPSTRFVQDLVLQKTKY